MKKRVISCLLVLCLTAAAAGMTVWAAGPKSSGGSQPAQTQEQPPEAASAELSAEEAEYIQQLHDEIEQVFAEAKKEYKNKEPVEKKDASEVIRIEIPQLALDNLKEETVTDGPATFSAAGADVAAQQDLDELTALLATGKAPAPGQMDRLDMNEDQALTLEDAVLLAQWLEKHPADRVYKTKWGVDVSRWQYQNDWKTARNAGVQFALVRALSTNKNGVYIDPMFERNVTEAIRAGVPVGVYYYTYANTDEEMINELTALIAELDKMKAQGYRFDYPIFIDVEDPSLTTDKAQLTYLVSTAMAILDQKGYYPGIYCSSSYANDRLEGNHLIVELKYPFWAADWRESVGYGWEDEWAIWQYTSKGKVPGIGGDAVDLNWCRVDFPSLIRKAHKNGY